MKEKLWGLYTEHYKKLFVLPLVLILLSIGILAYNYTTTGDIIDKDVSLRGGTTATIYTPQQYPNLEQQLTERFPEGDFFVRELTEFGTEVPIGIVVEGSNTEPEELQVALEELTGLTLSSDNYSVEFVGASLGESFYKQMVFAILLAFIFMAIVVFIAFRVPIPSLMVVAAAFGDMLCTLAVISLFDIQLSTAGIAAILLLNGYSVDTDILLTTRVLKKGAEGALFERLFNAMRTGLTMTATTIAALGLGYFVATSLVLKQMFLIIIIGLVFDVIMTYCFNAGLLIWYMKRRNLE